jgi:phage-related protein
MTPQAEPRLKPLRWIAASKKDLLTMPDEVQDRFGYALYLAQVGRKADQAKVLTGFGSAGVLEVVEDVRGSSYRAVYTVKFADAVYVLHCFQKKATKGIATPKHEMDKIRERLKAAEALAMRRNS